MNLNYVNNINKKIFINAIFFWLYFFFVSITGVYVISLYYQINIYNVPANYFFSFFKFTDLDLYFNVGLLVGIGLSALAFLIGFTSSIFIYNEVKYIYEYKKKYAFMHIFHSFLVITIIWIFIYQISWYKIYKTNHDFIVNNKDKI